MPLEGNKIDGSFKLYMNDSGLFVSMLEEGTAGDILSGNLGVYKGAIYENIVPDAFSKMGRKLYYFQKEFGLEIDFVIRHEGEVTLIEVKSTNGNTKSSRNVLNDKEHYHVDRLIKLTESNIGDDVRTLTLPYYLTFLLTQY